MLRKLTALLVLIAVPAMGQLPYRWTINTETPGETHTIDTAFIGNTPHLEVTVKEGTAAADLTDWTMYFRYRKNRNSTTHYSITGTKTTNVVTFIGTNAVPHERNLHFSVLGQWTNGNWRTFQTGRMLVDYDPAVGTPPGWPDTANVSVTVSNITMVGDLNGGGGNISNATFSGNGSGLTNIDHGTAMAAASLLDDDHTQYAETTDLDTFAEVQTLVADKTLINEEDTFTHDLGFTTDGYINTDDLGLRNKTVTGNATIWDQSSIEDFIAGTKVVDIRSGGVDVTGVITSDWTALIRKADGSEDQFVASADTPAARQVALQAAWALIDDNTQLHIGPGEFDTLGGWYQVGTRTGTPRVCELILTDKTNVLIQGHGTILKTTETGSHMVLSGCTNLVVEGITFLSTRPEVITTGGENLFGAIEVVAECKNITIRDCIFDKCGNHCIVDFKYANTPVSACTAERVIAHDCIFISCGDDDLNGTSNNPDAGMFAVTGDYCGMFNCVSFDCVRGFEMEGGTGGAGDVVGMFCIGNSMYDLTDDALMVFHPASGNTYKRFVFKDNFCHSVSGLENGDGLFMSGGEEWTITGNTFLNFGRGIVVTDGGVQTRYGLIEGNHVHNTGAGHGIYVEESGGNGVDWITVSGNRVSRASGSGFFIEGTSLQVIGNVASDNSKSGTGAGFYFENSVTTAHVLNNTAEDSASFNSQDYGFWFDDTLPANGIKFDGNIATPHVTSQVNIESAGDVDVLVYSDGSNNRVGVGTESPSSVLHVTGDEVRIGDAGTVNDATADGDLYVEDYLEVDGTVDAPLVRGAPQNFAWMFRSAAYTVTTASDYFEVDWDATHEDADGIVDLADNDWSYDYTGVAHLDCACQFNALVQNSDPRIVLTINDVAGSRRQFGGWINNLGNVGGWIWGNTFFRVGAATNTYKVELWQNDSASETMVVGSNSLYCITYIVPD